MGTAKWKVSGTLAHFGIVKFSMTSCLAEFFFYITYVVGMLSYTAT